MAKVKVVNTNLDQNLNGTNFTNISSETIFQFGSFTVTSNFGGRIPIDYSNTLSTFVQPVSLDTLGINSAQSSVLHDYQTNVTLNLDKSNLNTYVKFGSTYEFFRVAVQNIILAYPGSLFANSNAVPGGNPTYINFSYNPITDISTFQIPYQYIGNPFNLIFNYGNTNIANGALSNVNLSYDKYVVWTPQNSSGNSYYVIGFTGYTVGMPLSYQMVTVKTLGNPFPFNSGSTFGKFDFHIKPNNVVFEEFRSLLSDYEQYILASRDGINGFQFNLNDPSLLDDGTVVYTTTTMLWTTTDGYNIDTNTTAYQNFLNSLLAIGAKYDVVKTDLIARFLTPTTLKTYDTLQKMVK